MTCCIEMIIAIVKDMNAVWPHKLTFAYIFILIYAIINDTCKIMYFLVSLILNLCERVMVDFCPFKLLLS